MRRAPSQNRISKICEIPETRNSANFSPGYLFLSILPFVTKFSPTIEVMYPVHQARPTVSSVSCNTQSQSKKTKNKKRPIKCIQPERNGSKEKAPSRVAVALLFVRAGLPIEYRRDQVLQVVQVRKRATSYAPS